jgi:hypothetical protein
MPGGAGKGRLPKSWRCCLPQCSTRWPATTPARASALNRPPRSHLLDPEIWPAVLATITCFGVMFSSLIVLPARLAAAPYRLNEAQIGAANGGRGAGGGGGGRVGPMVFVFSGGAAAVLHSPCTQPAPFSLRPLPAFPARPSRSPRRPGQLPVLPRRRPPRRLGVPPLGRPLQRAASDRRARGAGAVPRGLPHVRMEPLAAPPPGGRAHG